jgi:hypothetical protein
LINGFFAIKELLRFAKYVGNYIHVYGQTIEHSYAI